MEAEIPKTSEQVIAELKAEMEEKYRKEREALTEKKRKERNQLKQLERKLKKDEEARLGKVLYETYGVTSVAALEKEYAVVKKGETLPPGSAPAPAIPEGYVLLAREKADLITAFYKETGEWCLNKQAEGGLKEGSVTARVANFFRAFYEKP